MRLMLIKVSETIRVLKFNGQFLVWSSETLEAPLCLSGL